jgi:hypothetical protein
MRLTINFIQKKIKSCVELKSKFAYQGNFTFFSLMCKDIRYWEEKLKEFDNE